MEFKLDLQEISSLANLGLNENKIFRSWLRAQDSKIVESAVEQISAEVAAQVDCTLCANCCKALSIHPTSKDIKRLADGLGLQPHELRAKYLKRDHEGDLVFQRRPCVFLKDNKCSVYAHRPETCRSYPHLGREHMATRGWYIVENTIICPIVFNTYEQLKEYFHFSSHEIDPSNE